MSTSTDTGPEGFELDPVFLNSRREAIVIFGVWFLCFIWTVPVSYLLGYGHEIPADGVPTVMGMPRWTFWGIVCPWLVADVITTWLCFSFIKSDDLGQAPEEIAESADAAAAGEDA